jgi:hypothetical protein
MKRKILIAVLALGVIGGFGAGFASLARHHRGHCHGEQQYGQWEGRHHGWGHRGGAPTEEARAPYLDRLERLERHVADLEAARGSRDPSPAP